MFDNRQVNTYRLYQSSNTALALKGRWMPLSLLLFHGTRFLDLLLPSKQHLLPVQFFRVHHKGFAPYNPAADSIKRLVCAPSYNRLVAVRSSV